MQIETHDVTVDGPHTVLLRPTTLTATSREVALVEGPPGTGHTALSLVLGGRLRPDAGTVLLDGAVDDQGLRERVALVDVPDVSEPDDVIRLSTVVGEELAMARRTASPAAVRAWLDHHDALGWHGARVEDVPGSVRIHLLSELAALRRGIEALVICAPDRYGTLSDEAYEVAARIARRDLVVVLQLMTASVRTLGLPAVHLGNTAAGASEEIA
ncbi:hypothetical protein BHE97_17660 [Aeromicrobium sp. PE09-221]|uniref:ATP-binding cassette domain-containing protein n=1 Tax=Aeromicrobium sp. PE09-221 TaxID=1898043 RepID=UPI000B6A75AD|nr:ABC transporter ATP-binding protein [Aeromicrobium sp. PE09-221]OUZ07325.1 hypothetical protein BHE97_17660 [Aeromicrobium sp. PE09-221]